MKDAADRIVARYERHALSWDADRRAANWIDKPFIERFLGYLPPGATVLDLGCGGGSPVATSCTAIAASALCSTEAAGSAGLRGWRCCPTMASVLLCSPIVIQARFRKCSPIMSSTGCAAKSRYPGSIVFVSGGARRWRSSKLTDRPGKRRGG
jgi:hypothetical protein